MAITTDEDWIPLMTQVSHLLEIDKLEKIQNAIQEGTLLPSQELFVQIQQSNNIRNKDGEDTTTLTKCQGLNVVMLFKLLPLQALYFWTPSTIHQVRVIRQLQDSLADVSPFNFRRRRKPLR